MIYARRWPALRTKKIKKNTSSSGAGHSRGEMGQRSRRSTENKRKLPVRESVECEEEEADNLEDDDEDADDEIV